MQPAGVQETKHLLKCPRAKRPAFISLILKVRDNHIDSLIYVFDYIYSWVIIIPLLKHETGSAVESEPTSRVFLLAKHEKNIYLSRLVCFFITPQKTVMLIEISKININC